MSDPATTPEDIEEQVVADVADGVQSVTADGLTVTQIDPMKRLDVADRLRRNAVSDPFATLNHKRLISPGGGF